MIFGRFRQDSLEGELLRALSGDDDLATGAWMGVLNRLGHVRNAVSSLTRDEAMAMIARGGDARIAAMAEHSDGRVREAALRALVPHASASLPSLLRRANDWVPAVARLAGERALTVLPQSDNAVLLDSLPLVFALTRQGRSNHGPLIAAYLHQTRTRRGLARRVRKAYRNGPVGEWASWRIVGDEETAHELTQERLKAGTPRLQFETARQVAAEPGRWRELLASRNPQVRRLALDHAPTQAVESLLDDGNAGVRNDARYLLGKRDYAAIYRARLPSPGAVSGMGETGSPDDAASLRPLLSHERAEVRARAVEALFRLLADDAEPLLLTMLLDPVAKVQLAAVEAIVLSNLAFDPESVIAWPLSASMRLKLLRRTPRWASLLAVLRVANTVEWADDWLVRWAGDMGYGRVPPKPDELAEAKRLLRDGALRPETAARLGETLSGWR